MLETALYKISYELVERPDWVGIPLRGVLALLDLALLDKSPAAR